MFVKHLKKHSKKIKKHLLKRNASIIFLFILMVWLLGSFFYLFAEKLSLLDAFYLSAVTLTTLGYGVIVPETSAGKMFTILYVFLGLVVVYIITFPIHHSLRDITSRLERLEKRK